MEFFTTPNSKTVIATLVTIERSELTFLLILMKKVTICNLYLAGFYFLISYSYSLHGLNPSGFLSS